MGEPGRRDTHLGNSPHVLPLDCDLGRKVHGLEGLGSKEGVRVGVTEIAPGHESIHDINNQRQHQQQERRERKAVLLVQLVDTPNF